jgi:phosphatidylserine/phosphatidylglycerophosphate/cardiolipin synthase-like enzyme
MKQIAILTIAMWMSTSACMSPNEPTDPNDDVLTEAATASPCVVDTLMGGARTFIHFTRPSNPCKPTAKGFAEAPLSPPNVARDFNIVAELKRLIDSVPAGGVIKGHIYQIDMEAIAAALVKAQVRGVSVWISTDPQVATSTDPSRTTYLAQLNHVVYCTAANGIPCIGTSTSASAASHVKLFTFTQGTSATGIPSPTGTFYDHVAWFGSANPTYGSGSNMFNNSVTIYGWKGLYDDLAGYLDDLYHQVQDGQYYDFASGRGYFPHHPATFYASPSPAVDLVLSQLNALTPDSACVIRLMQTFINDSRMDVVNRIVDLANKGCTVYVATDQIQARAFAALHGAALHGAHIQIRKQRIHDKVIMVHGNYSGTYQYRVYTGSHNLGSTANDTNDELFVRLDPEPAGDASLRPVYNAYYRHFYDAFDTGCPLMGPTN